MKYRHGILLFVAVCATLSPAQAQWWGSDSLPGNAGNYTYRTRLGYWQFGGELRNIATPQAFADRGIIRNWQDGMPVAVDRNLPGGRFAQPGVPNLVYVPRINYFDDLGYLTDFQFREGLRQYWPEDGRLLIDEWEEITHEPERLPPDTTMTGVSPREFTKNVQPPIIVVTSPQQKSIKPQAIVIKRISPERPQKKLTYHQQIMRRHAERRAAEEERLQQQIEQRTQLAQWEENDRQEFLRATQVYGPQGPVMSRPAPEAEPLWFRDVPSREQSVKTYDVISNYNMPTSTYVIPSHPILEFEKRLEYSVIQSPEISFFSPFQVKYDNGTVTITGTVGSEQEKQITERILLRQPEVQRVQNLLTVAE